MTKKIISIIVAAVLALSMLPAAGLAQVRNDAKSSPATEKSSPATEKLIQPADNEATVVLNVPEDIWGDGTGYQMLLDADATAYGDIISATGPYNGTNYADFEYSIPEDADCSANAQHIVVGNTVMITVPAGTYDYMITNPEPASGTIWIASDNGTVPGRADDYTFEAGYTYIFSPAIYGTQDGIDIEIIEGMADPSVISNVSISNFVEPVWGAAPSYDVTVPASANYTLTYTDWNWEMDLDGAMLEEGDVFDNEQYGYFMFFVIAANEGYTFAEDTRVTVNGNAAYVGPISIEANEIVFATVDFFVTEPIDLDLALNVEGGNIHFETEGDYPWVGVEAEDGRLYAQSSNAGVSSSNSVLSATVNVEEGAVVSFEFKAWGEGTSTYWDYCEFAIDGERVGYWGAYQNEEWELFTSEPLAAGEHTLTWTYHKDGSVDKPGDCFMIDNVQVPEAEVEPTDVIGDVNNNGSVDTADALMALRYVMGLIELTDAELAQAEVDGDGEATIVDSLLILRRAMGLIDSFPIEN